MSRNIQPRSVDLYFLPVETRVPLKFGPETLTNVFCARVAMTVVDGEGREAVGWGETPLSVQWAWPSEESYQERCDAMLEFCRMLARSWPEFPAAGHPMEIGHDYIEEALPHLLAALNAKLAVGAEPMPWLAALVCASAFDIALHDAYGVLHGVPVYETYNAGFMNRDLGAFLEGAEAGGVSFAGRYPSDYLVADPPRSLPACHLVGGMDALTSDDLDGSEPADGYPVTLTEWIERDGLTFLKVKLRGNDAAWDHERLVRVGEIAVAMDVPWLTADFNCTVTDPEYVNAILDRLMAEHPRFYQMMLYVEQPFPYELEENQIDVHSVSARKPLFMDESAHDWKLVRLGRRLGWTGVALKTCKTQTGALLSLCWAKAHGMTLMVQDLTNPMLAQLPHCQLAAHAGTIMGVETNAMQFYPEASAIEEAVHPGLYRRRDGKVDLSSIEGPGFGYRVEEIGRDLPEKELL
jgi:L-alanine-DL-glutamate epimerase-like enolase superfamily enzyme